MKKRFDLRDEPVIGPDLPIIDGHHHMFDRPAARYLLDDILEDIRLGHDIRATVYIESHFGFDETGPDHLKPVGETRFAAEIAEACAAQEEHVRVNAAIISYADMTDPRIGDTLDAHIAAGKGRLRGIRQVTMYDDTPDYRAFMFAPPPGGLMQSPDFGRGLRALADRGLSFDAAILHTQMEELGGIADQNPDTTFVLDHLGFAYGMRYGDATFAAWKTSLAELARRPNIIAKVGGFGMPFWGFGFNEAEGPATSADLAAAWKPWAETGIEIFGVDRCMMESNFPADGHSCGYVPLWNALKSITADFTPAEKRALYWDTASRVYGIDMPHPEDT
ncbi:amidohydrolase family protein [Arenibacterium halophilum]|uniref:Amidohydrolase-related domain-containing protein n=1 Tax=Arenibacterium halophilum TaxID=2583821 RepID=A0ABY2WZD7_9RHOB|nr:amidohydrolase family protein [Arenibacterium halophilum]TMV08267.1 hypothetical protein FGK64_20065 [Arenibacterium halophilum]